MTVELIALAFVPLLLLLMIVVVGRVQQARIQVNAAAAAAARAATLARTATAAQTDARHVVTTALGGAGLTCDGGPTVVLDTGALIPGGQVKAAVTCRVNLADLTLPGLPGSVVVTATEASPIDTFKATP